MPTSRLSRRALSRTLLAAAGLATSLSAAAAAPPAIYDEVAEADKARLLVLVLFSANRCGDCRLLDATFKNGPSAPLIARHFKVAKVDVGRFDRNVDIAESSRVPLKGQLIYATEGGELADARKMGDQVVDDFFNRITTRAL